MNMFLKVSIVCAVALAPAAVSFAQQAPEPTVAEYLCTFAGECGDSDEPEYTMEGPETKGFDMERVDRRPSATNSTRNTKARTQQNRTASASTPNRTRRNSSRTVASTATRSVATAAARSDLRVSFELGSAELTPQARERARVFAEALQRPQLEGVRFRIEGHTDSVGGRSYNRELSRRRAEAVADFLASLGVSRDRFEIRGYGFDRPLPGLSAGEPDNRRVEAVRIS